MHRWLVLALVLSLSGCLDPFRPVVDEEILDASELEWIITKHDQTDGGAFAPKIVQTEYRFDPQSQPPYAGYLLLVGVRGWSEVSSTDLLEKTRELMQETLEEKGVVVDESSEASGGRSLKNGGETKWFRLIGTSTSNGLFGDEEEIRAFAETFYDGRSKTAVIGIALAQTTETSGLLQVQTEDFTTWNHLVGDPFGVIDQQQNPNGLLYNVVTHG